MANDAVWLCEPFTGQTAGESTRGGTGRTMGRAIVLLLILPLAAARRLELGDRVRTRERFHDKGRVGELAIVEEVNETDDYQPYLVRFESDGDWAWVRGNEVTLYEAAAAPKKRPPAGRPGDESGDQRGPSDTAPLAAAATTAWEGLLGGAGPMVALARREVGRVWRQRFVWGPYYDAWYSAFVLFCCARLCLLAMRSTLTQFKASAAFRRRIRAEGFGATSRDAPEAARVAMMKRVHAAFPSTVSEMVHDATTLHAQVFNAFMVVGGVLFTQVDFSPLTPHFGTALPWWLASFNAVRRVTTIVAVVGFIHVPCPRRVPGRGCVRVRAPRSDLVLQHSGPVRRARVSACLRLSVVLRANHTYTRARARRRSFDELRAMAARMRRKALAPPRDRSASMDVSAEEADVVVEQQMMNSLHLYFAAPLLLLLPVRLRVRVACVRVVCVSSGGLSICVGPDYGTAERSASLCCRWRCVLLVGLCTFLKSTAQAMNLVTVTRDLWLLAVTADCSSLPSLPSYDALFGESCRPSTSSFDSSSSSSYDPSYGDRSLERTVVELLWLMHAVLQVRRRVSSLLSVCRCFCPAVSVGRSVGASLHVSVLS